MMQHIKPLFDWAFPYFMTLVIGYLGVQIKKLSESNAELRKQNQEKTKALEDGLCCLLRVKMIEYHDRYTEEDSISSHGLENFSSMYKNYHTLGGNGLIDHMYEDIKQLKIK